RKSAVTHRLAARVYSTSARKSKSPTCGGPLDLSAQDKGASALRSAPPKGVVTSARGYVEMRPSGSRAQMHRPNVPKVGTQLLSRLQVDQRPEDARHDDGDDMECGQTSTPKACGKPATCERQFMGKCSWGSVRPPVHS